MKKIIFVSLLVIALGYTQTAMAATDYLLKIDGVEGESSKSTGAQLVTGTAEEKAVACTMDAKMCPDGSYVGRTAPNCAFAPCPVESSVKIVPPPAPKPAPTPTGDPDFDLIKVAPSPVSPIYKETSAQGENPIYENDKKVVSPSNPNSPKSVDIKDHDDDGDNVPSKTEDVDMHMSVSSVVVRGWDPKKKEEFMSEQKEASEVRSGQELEHFAQGVLLADEKIIDVQFNPKELSVSYEAEGKLLWFIPVSYTERLIARGDEGGEVTFATKKPWWGFLVGTNNEGEEVAAEAAKKHKETIEISSWSFGASNHAMLLGTISNVLKTKHDTAKNSVGNIR